MAKPIAEIKREIEMAGEAQAQVLASYADDPRKGVQNLIQKAERQAEKLQQERLRLQKMREFEEKYKKYQAICGIDEAGRGPLAGPVVAGAVILPRDCEILYLNDSKKLSEKKRDQLYDEIQQKAVAWAVGIVSQERIDEINILQATYEAMQQAVEQLAVTPDLLLVDAVNIPGVVQKQVGIIKGDAKSVSIAAASIMAKVTRDRMMEQMDALYPEYGFASHKGYGSQSHIEAIRQYGPCPIHRRTFIKNFI
ncbi:MAG: ribonuclease HII [Eubacteriales bacterium]|nr:ribonuclease HII [Eubacteriales bacterium]